MIKGVIKMPGKRKTKPQFENRLTENLVHRIENDTTLRTNILNHCKEHSIQDTHDFIVGIVSNLIYIGKEAIEKDESCHFINNAILIDFLYDASRMINYEQITKHFYNKGS
jgi:hypothetical protein